MPAILVPNFILCVVTYLYHLWFMIYHGHIFLPHFIFGLKCPELFPQHDVLFSHSAPPPTPPLHLLREPFYKLVALLYIRCPDCWDFPFCSPGYWRVRFSALNFSPSAKWSLSPRHRSLAYFTHVDFQFQRGQRCSGLLPSRGGSTGAARTFECCRLRAYR